MNKKITLSKAREEFINRGYIPLFVEYFNNNKKLLGKTEEGYKFEISLANLKCGKTPKFFDTNNPYTIDNIKVWMKLKDKDFELLSTKYVNANSKIQFITNDGYRTVATWNNLIKGKTPAIFGKGNPHTINNIKLFIKINNLDIELLSNDFISATSKLEFYCKKHGKFETTWDSFRIHNKCKYCYWESIISENSYLWKGGVTPLHSHLRSSAINTWKKYSMEKCDYKCYITHGRFDVVHHLYGFNKILDETMKILNLPIYKEINRYTDEQLKQIEDTCLELHFKYGLGVCLCKKEHDKFHDLYGKGNNTLEQFEEFRQMRLKQLKEDVS